MDPSHKLGTLARNRGSVLFAVTADQNRVRSWNFFQQRGQNLIKQGCDIDAESSEVPNQQSCRGRKVAPHWRDTFPVFYDRNITRNRDAYDPRVFRDDPAQWLLPRSRGYENSPRCSRCERRHRTIRSAEQIMAQRLGTA